MSFFTRLSSLVESTGLKSLVETAAKTVTDAAAGFSLDALQDETAPRRALCRRRERLSVSFCACFDDRRRRPS